MFELILGTIPDARYFRNIRQVVIEKVIAFVQKNFTLRRRNLSLIRISTKLYQMPRSVFFHCLVLSPVSADIIDEFFHMYLHLASVTTMIVATSKIITLESMSIN